MTYTQFYLLYTTAAVFLYLYALVRNRVRFDREMAVICAVILFLSVLSAVRPMTVPDTFNYGMMYRKFRVFGDIEFSLTSRVLMVETGFAMIMHLFAVLGIPFRIFMGSMTFIILVLMTLGLFLIAKYINESFDNCVGLLALFLLFNGCHDALIAIRGGLALSIGLVGTGLLLNKKHRYIAVLLLLFDPLIHVMSVLIWGIYILIRIYKGTSFRTAFIISVSMAGSFFLDLGGRTIAIVTKLVYVIINAIGITTFNSYLTSTNRGYVRGIRFLIWIAVVGLIVCLLLSDNPDNRERRLLTPCVIGVLFVGLMYPLQGLYRILGYFFVFLIPVLGAEFEKNKEETFKTGLIKISFPGLFLIQTMICYLGHI